MLRPRDRLSLARIEDAARVIDPVFLHTPQFLAEALGAEVGCSLVLKVETVNPVRSFKGRGAEFFLSAVAPGTAVVCASVGNFGQGMAFAARKRGVRLVVYAAAEANALKLDRIRAFGATVVLHGGDFDDAKLAARDYALGTGVLFAEDGADAAITEGAGTIGIELLGRRDPLDAVLVPVGNGALISGVARWIKEHRPSIEVIGVCAEGAPAMARSWHDGGIVAFESLDTVAEGIGVRVPIPQAVDDMRDLVDDVVLVSDDAMLRGLRLCHIHCGLVVEPAGAAGIAALLEHRARFAGVRVGTILCGGNLTVQQVGAWLR